MERGSRAIATFVEFVILGIAIGAVYGLMAIPLSLVWNTTRTMDFAVGGYAVIGGVTAARMGSNLGPVVGVLLGGAFASIVGAAYLFLQSRGSAHTLAPVLASVGLLFALVSFTQWRFGLDPAYVNAFPGVVEVAGLRIARSSVVNVAVAGVLTLAVVWSFRKTRLGRWMRACAVSAEDAPLVGIPVRKIQFATFVMVGVLSALAGLLLVASRGLIYDAGFPLALLGIGALIVYGMRGPVTALAGGMTLGIVESLGTAYLPIVLAPIAALLFLLLVLGIGKFDVEIGVSRP